MPTLLRRNAIVVALLFSTTLLTASCDSGGSGNDGPDFLPVTSVVLTLQGIGTTLTTTAVIDAQGEGSDVQRITVASGVNYQGSLTILSNGTDITDSIEDAGRQHRIFFTTQGGLGKRMNFEDLNTDSQHNPLGTTFTLAVIGTGEESGMVNVKLRRYPDTSQLPDVKLNDNGIADIDGTIETVFKFDVPFTVVVL